MPDGSVIENVPDDITQSELLKQYQRYQADQAGGTEFTRGIARGTAGIASLISEGVPALTKGIVNKAETAVGLEPSFDPNKNLDQYTKDTEEAAKKYPTKFASITDIGSLADVGGYVASAAGEGLPSIATSIAGGGVGAFAAKNIAKQAMMRAGTSFATKEAEDAALNEALKKGIAYGAVAASAPMNIPETYLGLLSKGKDDPMLSLTIGSAKTYLDTLVPETQLGKLFGTQKATDILTNHWLKELGIEAGKIAGMEGLTEATQEGLDILAENLSGINPNFFTADNFVRLADNGLRGAIPGGLVGGATHAVQIAPALDRGAIQKPGEPAPTPQPTTLNISEQPLPKETPIPTIQQELPLEQPAETILASLENEPQIFGGLNIFDSTLITPTHLLEQEKNTADMHGIDVQSLANLPMEERHSALAYIDKMGLTKQGKPKKKPGPKPVVEPSLPSIFDTLQEIKDQSPDTSKIAVTNTQRLRKTQASQKPVETDDTVIAIGDPNETPLRVLSSDEKGIEVQTFRKGVRTPVVFRLDHGNYTKLEIASKPKMQKGDINAGVQGFYSKLNSGIDTFPIESSVQDYRNRLRALMNNPKSGIKKEEWNYSKIDNFLTDTSLDPKETITREHIKLYNQLGSFPLETYVTPNPQYPNVTLEGNQVIQGYQEKVLYFPGGPPMAGRAQNFVKHFISNAVVHMRSSLINLNGIRTRFIQEMQSDVHQRAQKLRKIEIGRLSNTMRVSDDRLTPEQKQARLDAAKQVPPAFGYISQNLTGAALTDLTLKMEQARKNYEEALKPLAKFEEEHGGISLRYAKFKETVNTFAEQFKKNPLLYDRAPKAADHAIYSFIQTPTKTAFKEYLTEAVRLRKSNLEYWKNRQTFDKTERDIESIKEYQMALDHVDDLWPLRQQYLKNKEINAQEEAIKAQIEPFKKAYEDLKVQVEGIVEKVPNYPYKGTSWVRLALRKEIHDAIKEGLTQIAIPKKEAVKKIQRHSDFRASKFYERTVVEAAKEISKDLHLDIHDEDFKFGGDVAPLSKGQKALLPLIQLWLHHYDAQTEEGVNRIIKDSIRYGYETEDTIRGVGPYYMGLLADRLAMHMISQNELLTKPEVASAYAQLQHESETTTLEYIVQEWNKATIKADTYPVTVIKFTPETFKAVREEGVSLFQKGLRTPQDSWGDAYNDIMLHSVVEDGIRQTPFTKEANEQLSPILDMAKRVVKEVTGNADLKFFNQLVDDTDGNPIFGVQFRNLIKLAINDRSNPTRVEQTAYHESWHMLEARKVFSKQMIKTLDNNTALLRKYADQDEYLSNFDFDWMMQSPEWREELRANAFGKFAIEYNQTKQMPLSLPAIFKAAFRQAKNIIEKIGNGLNGLGFSSTADIFESAIEGQHANENIDQLTQAIQHARYQRAAKKTQKAQNNDRIDRAEDTVRKLSAEGRSRKLSNDSPVNYGWYTKQIRSIYDLATKNPMAASVLTTITRRYENSSVLMNSYHQEIDPFLKQTAEMRHQISDLADHLSTNKIKTWISDGADTIQQGPKDSLNWIEDGQLKTLIDPAAVKAYTSLQNMFAKVLDDSKELHQKQVLDAHSDVLSEGYTLPDLYNAMLEAKKVRKESPTKEKKYQSLKNAYDRFEDFQNMRKYDYFPKMRFGTYGIAVHDLDGNEVAFYTLEKGYAIEKYLPKGSPLYNKAQMANIIKELKEKYSDTSKYKIIGHDKVFDFNNPRPFTMNYNRMSQKIADRFVTNEFIYSLLYSQGADAKALEDSLNDIKLDITQNKFERRFSESRNIPGYSKDYDRVVNTYMSSASHFIASQNFVKEIGHLRSEIEKLSGETGTLQKTLLDYIEYVQSPQEDLQTFRTINFLWTMGGNISTALLQTVTLPTMTLGMMSMFSPNIVKNMQIISKHFKEGIKLASKNKASVLSGPINFADWMESKDLAKVAFNKHLQETGKLIGVAMENQGKLKTFETDTTLGKMHAKLDVASRLLGKPVSMMEQITRYATLNAARELLITDSQAMATASRILSSNPLVQEMIRQNPDLDFASIVAEYVMDNAHGVFGKQGRPEVYKGFGGAIIAPFQIYPHYALEAMARMYGTGAEGKRAFATTLGAMFLIGGLMGLPGVDLLKELLEALENQLTGTEYDYQYMIQQKLYDWTGGRTTGDLLVGGLTRGALGMEVSKRTGLGIPGQELLLTVLGIRGQPGNLLGVQGSIITQAADAFHAYTNGDSGLEVGAAISPTAIGNVLRSASYFTEGKRSRNGTQILTANDVSAYSKVLQALGIRSTQIAAATEKAYYDTLLQNKYKVAIDRFRKRVANIKTDIIRARDDNDMEEVNKLQEKLNEEMGDLHDFVKANNIPAFPWSSFNKTTNEKADEATSGQKPLKMINKSARPAVMKKNQMYEGL